MRPLEVGDEVVYTAAFLRNTGQQASNDPCVHTKGEIEEITALGASTTLAKVRWPHGEVRKVNVANLCRPLTAASIDGPPVPNGTKLPDHMIRSDWKHSRRG